MIHAPVFRRFRLRACSESFSPTSNCSGALGIGQHCLPQNAVHPRLIAFAPLLQPCDHVGVQSHGNGLLHRTIEPAPNRVFPCVGRKLRDIRSIDLIVGQRGQSRQFSLLSRSEAASRRSLRFPILSCFAHTCSVRGALPFVPKRCGSLPRPHLPCERREPPVPPPPVPTLLPARPPLPPPFLPCQVVRIVKDQGSGLKADAVF